MDKDIFFGIISEKDMRNYFEDALQMYKGMYSSGGGSSKIRQFLTITNNEGY